MHEAGRAVLPVAVVCLQQAACDSRSLRHVDGMTAEPSACTVHFPEENPVPGRLA